MKRLFVVFSTLILLGAGCGSSPSAVPTTTTTPAAATPTSTQVAPIADVVAPAATTTPVADPATDPGPEPLSITMTSGNFFFDPATITASPGQKVSISFTDNEGVHTFVIDELGVKKSITTGTVITFTVPSTPGSYAYYCDIGAHRKLGMEGVLIVK